MDTVRCPLRLPPHVVQAGCNQHGRVPRERFRMPGLWGIHFYHYSGAVEIAGRKLHFTPGQLSLTPPDTDLVWHFPRRAPHHYLLVRFPTHLERDLVALPMISQPPERLATIAAWEDAIAVAIREPARAAAFAWQLLWSVLPVPTHAGTTLAAAGVPTLARQTVHPVLQASLRIIDSELDRTLTLSSLARRAGISPNHLLRLFRETCGSSVMAYVRQRRALRAKELILGSSLPIRAIGAAVGMPDAQRFNKLMRTHYGVAPSALRRGG